MCLISSIYCYDCTWLHSLLIFVYFVLILSCLEDEVEENEKFQLVLVFFSFSFFSRSRHGCTALPLSYLFCFIFSSVRYLSCLSVSVITAILSCLVLSCSCHLALSGIFGKGLSIYSIIQVQQAISTYRALSVSIKPCALIVIVSTELYK